SPHHGRAKRRQRAHQRLEIAESRMRGDAHVRFGGRPGKTNREQPRLGVPVRPYTYTPMARGFCYQVGIIDVGTRRLLAWRLSNSMDTRFCLEALGEALERFGLPEIFNSDQGAQFTSS